MAQRTDLRVPHAGEDLAVYLYRPDSPDRDTACIVMAHGFSGTRDDGLPAYADEFCAAGHTVALFDYRGFGASTGEPRQVIDIAAQHADYRAVVQWARTLDGVDPTRIALWGSSFSGGHVLAVAAEDPSIAAVVSQAPFTDALPTLAEVPVRNSARLTVAALRDQLRAWRGRPPLLVPAVGPPGSLAAMTAPDAEPGFRAIVGPESRWRNEFAARLMLKFPFYRPGRKTARLSMPLLVCVCDEDTTAPPGSTVAAAQRAPLGELRHYPYGHFAIYLDPQTRADQREFLDRALARP
ncbi:alpha/beta hydrolase [Mycobacterium adipatum]|uniref:alpha/beta hydrolase n=1 Tax=Mycobacterium adipatum TaxID=1682113 RepID=UPI0012E8F72D|nr:alpha/beta fold hydrolase [Mycobacterium adipatum]